MNTYDQLFKKIEDKTAIIGIIGLGYVGLPLAVDMAAAGYKVIGFDIQKEKVNKVNQGINYIGDIVDQELSGLVKERRLEATDDYSFLDNVDAVAICVPTPLDKNQQPDVSYVLSSAKSVAAHKHKGMLVILESTTYPGTTEEIIKPLIDDKDFVCGEDYFLVFSPERVDPGNKIYKTKNTPKVVGGVTKNCTKLAAALYRNVLEGEVYEVSSPKVAEMEKIYENTFRNINIGLANEMAILCNRMGIDIWEVIDAAKTKPYGFMAFYPGPGLGGHCIPLDPFYLTWKAREYNYHTKLIETSGEINNYMPEYIVERTMQILNKNKMALNGAKVLLLGVAYKKDIDDLRESPVLRIIPIMEQNKADLMVNDPYIPEFKHEGKIYKSVELTEDVVSSADIVIITTDHSNYDYDMIYKNAKIIFDTRNALKNIKADNEKIYKL